MLPFLWGKYLLHLFSHRFLRVYYMESTTLTDRNAEPTGQFFALRGAHTGWCVAFNFLVSWVYMKSHGVDVLST